VDPPDREHVGGVAARDEHEMLPEEQGVDVVDGPIEEGQVGRLSAVAERRIEVGQRRLAVGPGSRDVADPRPVAARALPGERQQERVQATVLADRELERPAADRDDEAVLGHDAQSRTDGGRSRSNMWTVSMKRTCLVV
jgi:hypothetical protein